MLDLYAQLVLKQGQIEVESQAADLPPDQYRNTNVELIHRREVEDLNQSIIVTLLSRERSRSNRQSPFPLFRLRNRRI